MNYAPKKNIKFQKGNIIMHAKHEVKSQNDLKQTLSY